MTSTEPASEGADAASPETRPGSLSMSWVRIVALVLAVAFLAGVVGWRIGRPSDASFNDVDLGFMADMVAHHENAIALSFGYLPNENDSVVTQIAREIIRAQSIESNTMNVWLGEGGDEALRVIEDGVAMDWMGEPVALVEMPGLATADDLEELGNASGIEADEIFTRLMIEHHAAGAVMAEYAAEHGESEKARTLARYMARNQRSEIGDLNARRARLGLAEVVPEAGGHTAHG